MRLAVISTAILDIDLRAEAMIMTIRIEIFLELTPGKAYYYCYY